MRIETNLTMYDIDETTDTRYGYEYDTIFFKDENGMKYCYEGVSKPVFRRSKLIEWGHNHKRGDLVTLSADYEISPENKDLRVIINPRIKG